MKVAGWVTSVPHGGRDYYLALSEDDPFEYTFNDGVARSTYLEALPMCDRRLEKSKSSTQLCCSALGKCAGVQDDL